MSNAHVEGDARNEHQNKSAGGLLLMYTLHAVLQLAIVPARYKEMFRECLLWIGTEMGIGQAELLADVCVPFYIFLKLFAFSCSMTYSCPGKNRKTRISGVSNVILHDTDFE